MKKMTAPFKECLTDFFKRFGISRTLKEFVGVQDNAERGWRNQGVVPKGEIRLRIQCFLEECGYTISESKEASKAVNEVAACIAFDCIKLESVGKRLEMGKDDQFFSYLFRGDRPSKKRQDALETIWSEFRSQLEEKRSLLREKLEQDRILGADHSNNGKADSAKIIADFAKACEQIVALGAPLLEGTREQRFIMRQQIGTGSAPLLHRSWDVLNRLLKEDLNPSNPKTN